jgi:RND family efflux transporter MFP subunit
MPRRRTAALLGLLTALAIAGCGKGKGPPPAPPTPKVTVARPVEFPVSDFYEYNGYLESPEVVEVRARVKGFLNRVHFTEGAEVAGETRGPWGLPLYPGELLYEIDKREYVTAEKKAAAEVEKAKADVKNWAAQIELAQADLDRVRTASKSGVASKTDLDKAEATLKVNQAEWAAALATQASAEAALRTASIQLGYTDIRAKISGKVGRTLVTDGNLVGQTDATLLTTIIRIDTLHAFFDVPERDLLEYLRDAERYNLPTPPQQKVPFAVRLPGPGNDWHPGEIDYVDGRVNTGTGTVRVRGVIDNPVRPSTDVRLFVPGFYVQVRVPKGTPRPRLVIPEDAIMTGQEGRFVYVVGEGNAVLKKAVTVGPSVWKAPAVTPGEVVPGWVLSNPNPSAPPGGKGPPPPTRRPVKSVVAVAGLAAADRVVVDGVQRARVGGTVEPEDWVMSPPPAAAN